MLLCPRKHRYLLSGVFIVGFLATSLYLFLPGAAWERKHLLQTLHGVEPIAPPEPEKVPHDVEDSGQTDFCLKSFGEGYLRSFQETVTEYCTNDSLSQLACFHAKIAPDSRVDSFCYGTFAALRPGERKFALSCRPRPVNQKHRSYPPQRVEDLPRYWYDTGPGHIFTKDVVLKSDSTQKSSHPPFSTSILVRREGPNNLWHSLMEIFSMALTIEALKYATTLSSTLPYIGRIDANRTQVVIVDQHDNGPYYDLWSMVGNRPTIRLSEGSDLDLVENIVVPLAGSSNPLWFGDWEPHSCRDSTLLKGFVRKVLNKYKLFDVQPSGDRVQVTVIRRAGSRRLLQEDELLNMVREKLPHALINSVDFAELAFEEQLRVARESDILVGVHGAGLTHGMFMRPGSAMVEILPPVVKHKGFRNVAGLLQHKYFSAHGHPVAAAAQDWHVADVGISAESFSELVAIAVKTMYNQGRLNIDAV